MDSLSVKDEIFGLVFSKVTKRNDLLTTLDMNRNKLCRETHVETHCSCSINISCKHYGRDCGP